MSNAKMTAKPKWIEELLRPNNKRRLSEAYSGPGSLAEAILGCAWQIRLHQDKTLHPEDCFRIAAEYLAHQSYVEESLMADLAEIFIDDGNDG